MNKEQSNERATNDVLKLMEGWEKDGVIVSEGIVVTMSYLIGALVHASPSKTTVLGVMAASFNEAYSLVQDIGEEDE